MITILVMKLVFYNEWVTLNFDFFVKFLDI